MKQALDMLRSLRAEAPNTGSDFNKGFFSALDELEDRYLEVMWENGEDDATV